MKHISRFIAEHQKALLAIIPAITFIIGVLLPSPLGRHLHLSVIGDTEQYELSDTANMALPDGSMYNGTIIAGTTTRQGFGRLTTPDGSVYEGNWRDDKLPYGQRMTASSVYTGRFDESLNNEGFGIIRYSDEYIKGKRKQGNPDNGIVSVYIGNWHNNNKHGMGRSIKADGSMDFGKYSNGIYQKVSGTNYRVGGSIYGIDVSHYQADIDWDNLALYCNKDGSVYNGKPKDRTFMQPVFFAYIKATEGATIKDQTYNIRAIEAERHGIAKGAYHFLHLGSSVEDQVKNFLETVTWTAGDMPPALDVEVESEILRYGEEQLVSMMLSWLEKVEESMHVRPIIYTRENIRNKYLHDGRFKKYDFWIARYKEDGPDNFDWHFWQMTEKGTVNGYNGNIDINLFKGDYAAFRKYIGKNGSI